MYRDLEEYQLGHLMHQAVEVVVVDPIYQYFYSVVPYGEAAGDVE